MLINGETDRRIPPRLPQRYDLALIANVLDIVLHVTIALSFDGLGQKE